MEPTREQWKAKKVEALGFKPRVSEAKRGSIHALAQIGINRARNLYPLDQPVILTGAGAKANGAVEESRGCRL